MGMIHLPPDFKEFLKLLNAHNVRYLLIGGYAVAYHGYPRTTGDMDIWIALDDVNAKSVIQTLQEFGFDNYKLSDDLFTNPNNIVRMGIPPYRIEIMTSISGIDFESSYVTRINKKIDGVDVPIISKKDLILNKKAAGRNKDLDDLENLENA